MTGTRQKGGLKRHRCCTQKAVAPVALVVAVAVAAVMDLVLLAAEAVAMAEAALAAVPTAVVAAEVVAACNTTNQCSRQCPRKRGTHGSAQRRSADQCNPNRTVMKDPSLRTNAAYSLL